MTTTKKMLRIWLQDVLSQNPHGWTLKQLVEIVLGEDCPYRNHFLGTPNVVQSVFDYIRFWEKNGLVVVETWQPGVRRYRWRETTGFRSA